MHVHMYVPSSLQCCLLVHFIGAHHAWLQHPLRIIIAVRTVTVKKRWQPTRWSLQLCISKPGHGQTVAVTHWQPPTSSLPDGLITSRPYGPAWDPTTVPHSRSCLFAKRPGALACRGMHTEAPALTAGPHLHRQHPYMAGPQLPPSAWPPLPPCPHLQADPPCGC